MTHKRFLSLLLVLWALTLVQGDVQGQGEFELRTAEGGVKVYVRSEVNDEMSVRVTTSAKATVGQALSTIDDAPQYPEWVHRCAEAYVLPGGDANAYTYYSRIDMPFPFGDREVVGTISQTIDPETGVLTRTIQADPEAIPPNKGVDRIGVYSAVWIIAPKPEGGIDISCTVRTAAGAGLPNWLRKEVMTGGPAKTVRNLVARLEAVPPASAGG